MSHYLVFECKTPGCGGIHKFKRISDEDLKRSDFATVTVPCPNQIRCPKCGVTYDYKMQDLRKAEMPPGQ
jgi:hypothetical protein